MDAFARLSQISSIHLRRRRTEHLPRGLARGKQTGEPQEEEPAAEPLDGDARSAREQKGLAHRNFHRRQVPDIATVVVDVVATVDQFGNILAQQTLLPALPSVLAVPTIVLPSVPAVPPFPSDLTVPAVPPFPFPSGVPSIVDPSNPPLVTPSPVSATPSASTPAGGIPSSFATSTLASSVLSTSSTSTSSSTSSSPSPSSTSSSPSTSQPSTSSASSATALVSSTSSSSSVTSVTSVSSASVSTTGFASATPSAGGGGGHGLPANTLSTPTASNTPAGAQGSGSGSSTPTPTVVGSVVGSLAGFALILAIILILIRRHKQKQMGGALQLRDDNDTIDNRAIPSSEQQMASTRGSVMPAAGATAFLGRFSGASRSTAESSVTGEKGFQRISGRKLPSAFSEGMTSEQFARDSTLSGSSLYHDDQGLYGGPGAAPNKEFGKEIGPASGAVAASERIMPSPARTPVIHHPEEAPPWGTSYNGGHSTLSPPHTPNVAPLPLNTLGRSHPSHDGSRSSRFTEDV